MRPLQRLRSRTVVLPDGNIDTDRIIPARFLTTTERSGLGAHLFADWRYAPDGRERADFPLNRPEARDCAVLVAGPNFGCGSSREHAPWALLDFGFRAVVSTAIADIFRSNSLKNGLLPLIVPESEGAWLLAHPGAEVDIDIATRILTLPDGTRVPFPLEPFAQHCLLEGLDELGYLLARRGAVEAYERAR
ncbi:MAG: 3-isopropylmalate dehydratase small subunit [Gammaproteobacteria bacterium]|nr:3-isopropylmalate dehydratase small subunit [Gammaproteobacteria bacterium]MBV9622172.1 3-isopropylmalate dehydratase small subunit [Gammaproteobacteria bacterium]